MLSGAAPEMFFSLCGPSHLHGPTARTGWLMFLRELLHHPKASYLWEKIAFGLLVENRLLQTGPELSDKAGISIIHKFVFFFLIKHRFLRQFVH